jgi:hypothetical protein
MLARAGAAGHTHLHPEYPGKNPTSWPRAQPARRGQHLQLALAGEALGACERAVVGGRGRVPVEHRPRLPPHQAHDLTLVDPRPEQPVHPGVASPGAGGSSVESIRSVGRRANILQTNVIKLGVTGRD